MFKTTGWAADLVLHRPTTMLQVHSVHGHFVENWKMAYLAEIKTTGQLLPLWFTSSTSGLWLNGIPTIPPAKIIAHEPLPYLGRSGAAEYLFWRGERSAYPHLAMIVRLAPSSRWYEADGDGGVRNKKIFEAWLALNGPRPNGFSEASIRDFKAHGYPFHSEFFADYSIDGIRGAYYVAVRPSAFAEWQILIPGGIIPERIATQMNLKDILSMTDTTPGFSIERMSGPKPAELPSLCARATEAGARC